MAPDRTTDATELSTPALRGDRYQIQRTLGRGGMGVVFAAFDQRRAQTVALKCLLSERFQTSAQRERGTSLFEREYHALSQLAHPHIIEVYDYGRDELGPYYSMECLSGESLHARSPVSWREACALIRDVVSALALLHSRSLVHRDLTPMNIYCPPDRPTKLLDFGAMMPVGLAKQIVGTPAFTAPECLEQQSLDAQTDLYSVGACLYYAIARRPAYPARSFSELHAVWQTPPPPLAQFAPDIPRALDELVSSLLSAAREDRPRAAAEVYERLTVIADLSRDEAIGSAQSYLTRPTLVGRGLELRMIADAARAAAARTAPRGSSLLVRAERGLGRSRLLDAAVVEARLAGLRVARTDGASGHADAFGAARALLHAVAPDPAADSTDATPHALDSDARGQLLHELSCKLFASSDETPLALIVDDVHTLDEPSRALLAMLAAHASEHPLLILCSADAGAAVTPGSASALLAHYSETVPLAELDAAQTRELMVSIVGEVPNVDVLSVVAQRHCRGNPRALIESIEELIEQGVLRYEGGHWSISNTPLAIEAALDRDRGLMPQLLRLSADARELLELIAFDAYQVLSLASYAGLLQHRDHRRMHRALSELVASRWVELREDRVLLARSHFRRVLVGELSAERCRQLHAGFAELCANLKLPEIYAAHHLLQAERPEAAITALEHFSAAVEQQPRAAILREPITLTVTDAVSRMPDVPGFHPALRAKFMTATVLNAITYRGLPEVAAPRLAPALQLIAPFSGLGDYAALSGVSEPERLREALTRAAQRCASPGLGGLNVVEALRAHTRLCIAAALAAHFMCDPTLLEAIPDLTPFLGLSPVLRIAAQFIAAVSQLVHGQVWAAWDALLALDRELGAAAAQIDTLTHTALSGVVLAHLAALHADYGVRDFPVWADRFARFMPDHAESLRSRWHFAQGDIAAAAAARRRFEVLSVRMGNTSDVSIMGLPSQLAFYAACDDSIGLRGTHAALQEVARARPGWQVRAELAQAQLLRCQGRAGEALPSLEALMARLEPHGTDASHAAATHLELLNAMQRWDAAAALGRTYLARARAGRQVEFRIELALARACAELQQGDEAEALYAHACAQLEARNITGVLTGIAHEVGASIALARNDVPCASARLEACAEQYNHGRHPALTARYHALRRTTLAPLSAAPSFSELGERGSVPPSAASETQSMHETSDVLTITADGA